MKMFSFFKSLEQKRRSYQKTQTSALDHAITIMLFEGKNLTEILSDERIVEYLYSDEQFEGIMHIIDVKASILLQKKLISQFIPLEQVDPKQLNTIKNRYVRKAILERNRRNLFTCCICGKWHHRSDLKINEPVTMKCDFCNFEIFINKRESGGITRRDNEWRKFEEKMEDIEVLIAEIDEQIEEIEDAIYYLIDNPDDYEPEADSHLEIYRKFDRESLKAKKEPLLLKRKKLEDKLDPLIDKRFDKEEKFRKRMNKWKKKYKKYDYNKFMEEVRNC